jgi:hypothetical protein
MSERYWLVHPNGGRQLIDPRQFDVEGLAEQVQQIGGRLIVERDSYREATAEPPAVAPVRRFEPPISALKPLFCDRFAKIYRCQSDYELEINVRPTSRVLGGYYKTRKLVRVYSHDRQLGRRPLDELFDTYLHEMAHHIEYTEPDSYHAAACGRVPGRMHSRLFWKILGDLKWRWAELQRRGE